MDMYNCEKWRIMRIIVIIDITYIGGIARIPGARVHGRNDCSV